MLTVETAGGGLLAVAFDSHTMLANSNVAKQQAISEAVCSGKQNCVLVFLVIKKDRNRSRFAAGFSPKRKSDQVSELRTQGNQISSAADLHK
jgi:hypothetical protein